MGSSGDSRRKREPEVETATKEEAAHRHRHKHFRNLVRASGIGAQRFRALTRRSASAMRVLACLSTYTSQRRFEFQKGKEFAQWKLNERQSKNLAFADGPGL